MSKTSSKTPEIIELTSEELDSLFKRLGDSNLSDHDKRLFKGVIQTYIWMKHKYDTGKLGLHKLGTLLFGKKSEKRHNPGKDNGEKSADESSEEKDQGKKGSGNSNSPSSSLPQGQAASLQKPKGHGRFGADAYANAETVMVEHPTLKPGDPCPESCGGKLYSIEPGVLLRMTGQDIAKAIRYHTQKLRCNTCGLVVKTALPAEIGDKKYSCRFKSILAVQKYFMGVPFFRQEEFQKLMDFPLPDSTQWDLIEQIADGVHPVFGALEKQAALARIVYNDDTPVKIVEVMQLNKKDPSRERTGMFTTGIYAQLEGSRGIVLYYSGTRHAGENLASVLKHRPQDLPPIIHMSDALSANLTGFLVYWAKCMTHARHKFIEIELFFPEECRFVIDQFAAVYYADDQAKKACLSGKERLVYHQKHSKPVMQKLKRWMDKQIREKQVEPNSGLGKSIGYMQRH